PDSSLVYRGFTGPRNARSTWPHRAATRGRGEIMRELTRPRLPSRKAMLVASAVGLLGAAASLSAAAPSYTDWSTPVNLGPTINTTFNESGAALSEDGLSLYFNSNRPGGVGGPDIWVSQRDSVDDEWGAPVNLGPTINTTSAETVPAFSRDGHW